MSVDEKGWMRRAGETKFRSSISSISAMLVVRCAAEHCCGGKIGLFLLINAGYFVSEIFGSFVRFPSSISPL